jgi:hypothetical protein
MFIEDLGECRRDGACGATLVAIGWLAADHTYVRGNVPTEFMSRLMLLCRDPIRRTRGFHVCPFCGAARGNGEIHVRSAHGTTYAAPSLIGHYVEAHHYRPPNEFITAVNSLSPLAEHV